MPKAFQHPRFDDHYSQLVKYESNIETSRNLTLDQDDIIRRFSKYRRKSTSCVAYSTGKLREGVIASHRSDSFAGEGGFKLGVIIRGSTIESSI